MPAAAHSAYADYDRAQIEARFEATPAFVTSRLIEKSSLHSKDSFSFIAIRETVEKGRDVFLLSKLSGQEVARKLAKAPADLRAVLGGLAEKVHQVLGQSDDPLALEHEAILFWPALSELHSFLGMDLRADELIVACDVLRAQFQVRPVTIEALQALKKVLREASETESFTSEQVDGWVDALTEAGLELQLPLTSEANHAQ